MNPITEADVSGMSASDLKSFLLGHGLSSQGKKVVLAARVLNYIQHEAPAPSPPSHNSPSPGTPDVEPSAPPRKRQRVRAPAPDAFQELVEREKACNTYIRCFL